MNLYRITNRERQVFYVYAANTDAALDIIADALVCKQVTEPLVISPLGTHN